MKSILKGKRLYYNVFSYDLWYNDDFPSVNDVYHIGIIALLENDTDNDIIHRLKKTYLNKYLKNNRFTIAGEMEYSLYLDYNTIPCLELRKIEDISTVNLSDYDNNLQVKNII